MKRRLLFTVATAMLVSANSFSQLNFGIQAGGNLSNMSFKDDNNTYNSNNKLLIGFNVGGMLNYQMNDMFSIRTGVSYSQKGVRSENITDNTFTFGGTTTTYHTESKGKISLNYVEIPIALRTNLSIGGGNVFIEVGPYVGFAISGTNYSESTSTTTVNNGTSSTSSTDNSSSKESIKFGNDVQNDDMKGFDFGLYPALGFRKGNFEFSAAYKLGVSNLSLYTTNGYMARNKVLNFSIGYWFGMD